MRRQWMRVVAALAGSRRSSARSLLRILAVGAAVAAGVTLLAVAGARPEPAGAGGCGLRSELLDVHSPLDRPTAQLAGSFSRCDDPAHGLIGFRNDTPVAWTIPKISTATTAQAPTAATATFTRTWQASPLRGVVVAPGATMWLPDWMGPYTWRPDLEATRLYFAIDAGITVQAEAAGRQDEQIDRSARPSFDDAAVSCALVAVAAPSGAAPQTPERALDPDRIRSALAAARTDPGCRFDWGQSVAAAGADGWSMPRLRAAFGPNGGPGAEFTAAADRASAWFDRSASFRWRS